MGLLIQFKEVKFLVVVIHQQQNDWVIMTQIQITLQRFGWKYEFLDQQTSHWQFSYLGI